MMPGEIRLQSITVKDDIFAFGATVIGRLNLEERRGCRKMGTKFADEPIHTAGVLLTVSLERL